jgi:hypothetical protein
MELPVFFPDVFSHATIFAPGFLQRLGRNDIYKLDEGMEGSGMGPFLIVGHWPKILPQNSKGAS